MTFGERLKIARKLARMTQIEISQKLGITKTTYSRYENNDREPNVEKIKLLANLFNVSADFLLNTNKYNKDATLNSTEEKLLKLFRELNNKGQNKLLDSADDLVSSKKYEITATEEEAAVLPSNEKEMTKTSAATPVLPSNKEEPTKTDEYSDMTLDEIIEQTRILENLAKKKLAERSYKR